MRRDTAAGTRVADISVAIATRDRPDALARCLDALASGHCLPAEIVISDQGADGHRAVGRDRHLPRVVCVRHIRGGGRGLSASRNAAIAHATCQVIAITDDDCVPDPGWLAAIADVFDTPAPPAAVTGRVLPLGPPHADRYAVSSRTSAVQAEYAGRVLPWIVGTGGNTAIRRDWFHTVGGYDERLGAGSRGEAAEDVDLFYRLLRAGARIRYEPGAVVYHERQDRGRRLASRARYGYGMGAFCGIWLRRGDWYAAYMLMYWLLHQTKRLIAALVRARWMGLRESWLFIYGTLRGSVYGLRQEISP